jgi:hypothetical protein
VFENWSRGAGVVYFDANDAFVAIEPHDHRFPDVLHDIRNEL